VSVSLLERSIYIAESAGGKHTYLLHVLYIRKLTTNLIKGWTTEFPISHSETPVVSVRHHGLSFLSTCSTSLSTRRVLFRAGSLDSESIECHREQWRRTGWIWERMDATTRLGANTSKLNANFSSHPMRLLTSVCRYG
jgi:hypothetical protein